MPCWLRLPSLGWRSARRDHELHPEDIKQQHEDAEEDEKTDYSTVVLVCA
jgi:hypothetical protein